MPLHGFKRTLCGRRHPKEPSKQRYGHGHVEAVAAVMEAAQQDYQLDTTRTLSLTTTIGDDNRIHLLPGDELSFDINGDLDTVQWRSNHLRDDWANLHTFDDGDGNAMLDMTTIVEQLEHLPGIELEGNHTLSLRGLAANESGGHSATSVVTVNIMLMDTASAKTYALGEDGADGLAAWVLPVAGFAMVALLLGGIVLINRAEGAVEVETLSFGVPDEDIEAVVSDL